MRPNALSHGRATVRALAVARVVGSVCGALVAVVDVRSGVTNALGWSTVANAKREDQPTDRRGAPLGRHHLLDRR